MPEVTVTMTPFVRCPFLYQQIMKLSEETGEVCKSFYEIDTMESGKIHGDDILHLMEECGDVIQTAVNIITRCGYDVQEIMNRVTDKNLARGYYAQ